MLNISFDLSHINAAHWIVILLGYITVFVALTLLVYLFIGIPRIVSLFKRRQGVAASGSNESKPASPHGGISGEVNAAIATALFLYMDEMHDVEKKVMTIKKVSKSYSPWNSKIYGLNNMYFKKGSR
jgi:Na+-transporting methylmalonyl-CoA/oxaloacetate decarboxylase gamma subunit